jgi:predicted TPR repeat methyltransferase
MTTEPLFDSYADRFEEALDTALATTGEDSGYFARGRIAWLRRCLDRQNVRPRTVMDFGCGTGSATPHLLDVLGADSILGVDVSARSLSVAASRWASGRARFAAIETGRPAACDLVFCNGVFHHIAVPDRPTALAYIYDALVAGGWFAFWENNPWNPGTRYVMGRCAFDRDAIMLSPLEARALVRRQGFEIVRTDFLFVFPRALRALRRLEPALSRLPLGGQYQVLCRKPAAETDSP